MKDSFLETLENLVDAQGSLEVREPSSLATLRRARIRRQLGDKGIAVTFANDASGDFAKVLKYEKLSSAVDSDSESADSADLDSADLESAVPVTSLGGHSYQNSTHVDTIVTIFNNDLSHIVYLKGPTQCGKSTDVRQVARLMGRKLYTFSCNADTQYADLFGETDLKIDEDTGQSVTYWKKGIIEQACVEGLDEEGNEVDAPAILFIDEAPSMPAEIAIGLNRFLESDDARRELVVNRDGGRTIYSHSGLRIIMAGNTAMRGANTDTESFHTAQSSSLDLSFVKRIFACLNYGYNKTVERKILQEKLGDDKKVQVCLKFRDMIRDNLRQGQLVTPFTTKDLIKIADAFLIFRDFPLAVYHTIFGFLLPEEEFRYNECLMALVGRDILADRMSDEIDYM